MTKTLLVTITAALAAAAFAVQAQTQTQTLYKLIDKNGKVTYSEDKPKQFDGQVIPLTIDPNANTATLPKAPPPGAAPAGAPQAKKLQDPTIARLEAAQQRLEVAKAALQSARDNPGDADFVIFGNASGGVRRVPTEAYMQRLSRLEEQVRQAEESIARLEQFR